VITAPSSRKVNSGKSWLLSSPVFTDICIGQVAKNISKWNNKQTELAKPKPVNPNGPPTGLSEANSALGVRSNPSQAVISSDRSAFESIVDHPILF